MRRQSHCYAEGAEGLQIACNPGQTQGQLVQFSFNEFAGSLSQPYAITR
jgi:hypothetical protein